eukprot:7376127-Prymnesium_polylepis.2
MWCGAAPPPSPPASPPFFYPMFTLDGVCSHQSNLRGIYLLQGVVANGAPYYAHSTRPRYFYYDLDPSGSGASAKWVLDTSQPDPSRSVDLDDDGASVYSGHLATTDHKQCPSG